MILYGLAHISCGLGRRLAKPSLARVVSLSCLVVGWVSAEVTGCLSSASLGIQHTGLDLFHGSRTDFQERGYGSMQEFSRVMLKTGKLSFSWFSIGQSMS